MFGWTVSFVILWWRVTDGKERMLADSLGRAAKVGMYYDLSSQQIVYGPPLWSSTSLDRSNLRSSSFPSTDYKVQRGSNRKSKYDSFFLEGNVGVHILCGLVEATGGLSFATTKSRSNKHSASASIFSATTKFESIDSQFLERLDYPENLKRVQGMATHVIIGINYGAGAVFSFDSGVDGQLKNWELDGNIQASLNLQIYKVEAKIGLTYGGGKSHNDSKLRCEFDGDVILPDLPANLEESKNVVRSIPSALGPDSRRAVPQKLHLLSLASLSSLETKDGGNEAVGEVNKAEQEVKGISASTTTRIEDELDDYDDILRDLNDITDSPVARFHPRIVGRAERLKDLIDNFVAGMKEEIASMLPEVEIGKRKEKDLIEIFVRKNSGAMTQQNLRRWTKEKLAEITVLESRRDIPNRIASSGDFSRHLIEGGEWTAALTLRHQREVGAEDDDDEDDDGEEDNDEMFRQLKSFFYYDDESHYYYPGLPRNSRWWMPEHPCLAQLVGKVNDLVAWSQLDANYRNENERDVSFVFKEERVQKNEIPSVRLKLYQVGRLIDEDYQMPNKVASVNATWTSFTLTLKLEEPTRGAENVLEYLVHLYGDVEDEKERKSMTCGTLKEAAKLCKLKEGSVAGKAKKIHNNNNNTALAIVFNGVKTKGDHRVVIFAVTKFGKVSESHLILRHEHTDVLNFDRK